MKVYENIEDKKTKKKVRILQGNRRMRNHVMWNEWDEIKKVVEYKNEKNKIKEETLKKTLKKIYPSITETM